MDFVTGKPVKKRGKNVQLVRGSFVPKYFLLLNLYLNRLVQLEEYKTDP